jgi:hypothetical protein
MLPTRHRPADRLGGKPEDRRRLTLAIAALSHGTATQLLIPGVQESVVRELRQTCLMAAESLVESARKNGGGAGDDARRKRSRYTAAKRFVSPGI